jgi:lysophospholipase L1-like esterase
MIKKRLLFFYILLFVWHSCQTNNELQSYLALGDSYTIGESVPENQRWPLQLTKLLSEINNSKLDYPYDWVSLLIGVNNQYQGKSIKEFKEHFEILLSDAITFTGNNKEQVFVVSIPDWGVMPFSKNLDKEKIAKEIDDFNQVIYEVCVFKGVHFVDITPISRSAKNRKDFIAKDSLHPSGVQYTAWVQKIIPLFLN